MFLPESRKRCLLLPALLGCDGCSRAPSFEFIGSFFPVWMFCVLAALVVTGLLRTALVRLELEKRVSPLVVFYPCLAIALSCLLWLILFA